MEVHLINPSIAKNIARRRTIFASAIALTISATAFLSSANAAVLTWTTALNQTSTTTNQLRAVDISGQAGNTSVYLGWIQTSGVRRVDQLSTVSPYSSMNTLAAAGDQPKAIASDDRGNVFIGERNSGTSTSNLQAFSSTLSPGASLALGAPTLGGLGVHSTAGTYYAYAGFEAGGLLQRYNVTNPAAMFLDTTFGTGGSFSIAGATDIRGVDIDASGNIFAVSRGDNKIYRVSSDLSTTTFGTLTRPIDVDLFGGRAYVSSYNGVNSLIRVFDATTMSFIEDITITTLDGNPYSRGTGEGFAGIDITPDGRIFLADEQYNVSGTTQDRLLVSSAVPEPTSLVLFGLAGGCMLMRRRRIS